jgi:hypothetical protein
MALNMYTSTTSGPINDSSTNELLVDNVTTRITSIHDTSDGSYYDSVFYLKNEPISKGYYNIVVTLTIDGVEEPAISPRGIYYQIATTDNAFISPGQDKWENIPYNKELVLENIEPETESIRYFALRTYVPRGANVDYFTEANLKISAIEVVSTALG